MKVFMPWFLLHSLHCIALHCATHKNYCTSSTMFVLLTCPIDNGIYVVYFGINTKRMQFIHRDKDIWSERLKAMQCCIILAVLIIRMFKIEIACRAKRTAECLDKNSISFFELFMFFFIIWWHQWLDYVQQTHSEKETNANRFNLLKSPSWMVLTKTLLMPFCWINCFLCDLFLFLNFFSLHLSWRFFSKQKS